MRKMQEISNRPKKEEEDATKNCEGHKRRLKTIDTRRKCLEKPLREKTCK
jgi:hypothetical protein